MNILKSLNWRYATKKFDTTRKVSSTDLEILKEAVRLSASSFGLQPYKVINVEDRELREKLKAASYGQAQVTDASNLFVFCAYTNLTSGHIDNYINLTATTRNINPAELKGFGDSMKGSFANITPEQNYVWAAHQPYIALGNLLNTCAIMNIDACPMGGIDADKYDEILGLSKQGLRAEMIATIGYRSEEDTYQHMAKVRKPLDELFETR